MTVNDFKELIGAEFMASDAAQKIYGFPANTKFSDYFPTVSLEGVFLYVFAFGLWSVDKLFGLHKNEVINIITSMKPHSLRWYAAKAKEFQYGDNLIEESDIYDNSQKRPEDIKKSQIVTYSAVVEQSRSLLIKIAKNSGNDLAALSDDELAAFSDYINRVKDAGVIVDVLSREADSLRLDLDVYYNPLVLNSKGERIDGTANTPIENTIRTYLKNTPFNGMLVLAYLIDELQQVEGVVIPHIKTAMCKYGDLEWGNVEVKHQPFSGYTRLAELNVKYIPQSEIR